MLSIRPLQKEDIPILANYWALADPEHLDRMGVDPNKLPSAQQLSAFLLAQLNLPAQERQSYALIWEFEGRAIGHSNINPIEFGKEAFMHLHIWDASLRQRGSGTELVRMSVRHYADVFQLQRILSEPLASNTAPNRCLERAGFRLTRTYQTTPGSICRMDTVNRWEYIP